MFLKEERKKEKMLIRQRTFGGVGVRGGRETDRQTVRQREVLFRVLRQMSELR